MFNVARNIPRGLLVIALAVAVLGPTAASAQSINTDANLGLGNVAVYVVHTDDGTLVFGDGAVGQTPSVGWGLTLSDRYGAGAAGNIDTSPGVFEFESVLCMEFAC